MPHLRLAEYGKPVLARLSEDEAMALQEVGAGLDLRRTREAGVFEVRASNYVGTVVLPRRTVRIHPKVPVERLLHLLGFAPEQMRFLGVATAAEAPDVVTAMKLVYANALERLLVRGLRREYRDRVDDLVSLRGRVDAKHLRMRRFGLFPPVRCEFQEYTTDTEANRRLLAAALRLARAGDRRDRASAALTRLSEHFEGVAEVRYAPERVTSMRRDRLLAHYDPALSIAEVVLRNASLEVLPGRRGAVAFVVDMNKVYERYVAEVLRHELGATGREWRTQVPGLHIDHGRKLPMQPDVLWEVDGRPMIVLDTKYKAVGRATREDVHQVVTYAVSLGLRDAVLLYAGCPDETYIVRGAGVRVHQWRLSISGSVDDLRREVTRVAGKLRALVDMISGVESKSTAPAGGGHPALEFRA